MKNGDLSNTPTPRLVAVFEGLTATLSPDAMPLYDKYVRKNQWWNAVELYLLNELVLRKILDLVWRHNFNINLVTWMPEDAAVAITETMDDQNIPVRGCFSSSPEILARQLPYNPDIIKVYHAQTELALTFGSRGEYVRDINQIGRL